MVHLKVSYKPDVSQSVLSLNYKYCIKAEINSELTSSI